MRILSFLIITAPLTMANFFAPAAANTPALGPQRQPWQPESKFETFGTGLEVSTFSSEPFDLNKTTIAFIASHYSIDPSSLLYKNGYEDDVTKHAFVSQAINGIPFINAEAHVVYNRFNRVVTSSSTLIALSTASIASSTPTISREAAIASAESSLEGTYNNHPTKLEYIVKQDRSASLVYVVQVQNDPAGTWFEGYIDAHTGELVAATSFVAN